MTKQCGRCGNHQPWSAFTRDQDKRDGLRTMCRDCERVRRSERPCIPRAKTLLERMARKIIVDLDGCWLWCGHTDGWGYGVVKIDGVVRKAHRVMFELAFGRSPNDDLYVCHTCDIPRCVNPLHLWEGTAQENSLDREAKQRGRWTKARVTT